MAPRPPSSFTVAKMLYSLRRGVLPSPSAAAFQLRSVSRSISRSPTLRVFAYAAYSSPLIICLATFFYQPMWITGRSMTPFLNTDFDRTTARDAVIVRLWSPEKDVHRGDVVTFWTPLNPEKMAVKRIVALAGDEVEVRKGGKLYEKGIKKVLVPQGHIWVEGDNPEARFSSDSNFYGSIPQNLVFGRVVAGIWPRPAWVSWRNWAGSKRVKKNVVDWEEGVYNPEEVSAPG